MTLPMLLARLTATDEVPTARPFLYSTVAILFILGVCLTAAQFTSGAIFTLLLLITFTLAYQRTLHLRATQTAKETPVARSMELPEPRLRVLEESLSRDVQGLSNVLELKSLVTEPREIALVEAAQNTLEKAQNTLAQLRSAQVSERQSARLRELENLTRSANATINEVHKTT